jgi:hypothetical protein
MEQMIIWEAPVIVKPEFRLYYDERGTVLFYTCEKPEGNYIVIDAATYAQSRYDLRVVDGRLAQVATGAVVSKLVPSNIGITCAAEDISIVVDSEYGGDIVKWDLITNEY